MGGFWSNPSPLPKGGNDSKPEVEPPLLDKEWRPVRWNDKAEYLEYVKNFKPFRSHNDEMNEDQHIRILLHGPVGHGKSSFINSVDTILRGRMAGQALADSCVGKSFTKQYTAYKMEKEDDGTFYPLVFNDIMGLERDEGVREEDIKLAMMGHVRDGYTFSPQSTISTDDQYYNPNPSLGDKVHVLVCVVSASKLLPEGKVDDKSASKEPDDDAVKKMRRVRLDISGMGIPQIGILTNIDEACPEVNADLRKVYKSKFVKKKMELLSASLGIPLNCIFPVKNYHSEITENGDLEMLILMALRQMLNFGKDFAKKL